MFVHDAVADGSAENSVTVHADTAGEGELPTTPAAVPVASDRRLNDSPRRLERTSIA